MATSIPLLKFSARKNNGQALVGGKLYTFRADSNIPQDTYTTPAGDTENSNPIILDSRGEADVYLGTSPYKFVLYDSLGNLQYEVDNISNGGIVGSLQTVATLADLRNLPGGSSNNVYVASYESTSDGGSGYFTWSPLSVDADDDGIIVAPSSEPSTGRWIRQFSGPVNVRWFGANGLSGNDSDPIVNALASAINLGYSQIHFPIGTYYLNTTITIPFGITVKSDGLITGTGFLNFIGRLEADRIQVFGPSLSAAFSVGSVPEILPEWKGAVADGSTDSSDALVWAFAKASTQITGIGAGLASGQYVFTKTLRIVRAVTGSGWVLIAKGGSTNGANFKWATNPYTLTTAPAPVGGIYGSTFGCCVVIQDGGRLEGGSIIVVEDDENNPILDTLANQGTWLVNLEGNFGKNPLEHVRINGWSPGRYLGMCISRYNTTSQIGNFGGSYFSEGFMTDSCNICDFKNIFCEFLRRGGVPFQYYNSSHCTVNGNWTEGVQAGMVCYYFNSSSNFSSVSNLMVGEPEGGVSMIGTAADIGNVITFAGDNLTKLVLWENGDELYFDTAVAGLDTVTLYYLVNKSSTTAQVSLTDGGAAVDITANGSVTLRKAPSSAVRVNNCADMTFKTLKVEDGARWVKGHATWLTGTIDNCARNLFDSTYDPAQSIANTHSVQPITFKYEGRLSLLDMTDVTIYQDLGFIPNGTRLSMDVYSRSGAITSASFQLFKLSSGSVYTSQGFMNGGDIAGSGLKITLTKDLTSEGPMFIRPTSGSGYVDIYYNWNQCNSLALVS